MEHKGFTLTTLLLVLAGPAVASEVFVKVGELAAPIPLNPFHRAWEQVPATKVPLMAQAVAPPGGGGGTGHVMMKVLQCRRDMFFRVEWADSTVNDYPSRAEGYSDAVALQFPAQPGTWPSPFMGDADHAVVIWRWSASAQKDLDGGYQSSSLHRPRVTADLYAYADDVTFRTAEGVGNIISQRRRLSPVENLAAKGFGTLTFMSDQPVLGKGVWKDGHWHVVFHRVIQGTPAFWKASQLPLAAAVWDGGRQERDGMKSLSIWHTLVMPGGSSMSEKGKVAQGRRVFLRYGCSTCHGRNGEGGVKNFNAQTNPIPPLKYVKEGFSREEVREVIFKGREPARKDPSGPPPPFRMNPWKTVMTEEEVQPLIDYLFSLQPKGESDW